MKEYNDFAVFILTNGRPNNVYTYKALRKHGYTGKIYLVLDNLDPTYDEYKARYGAEVVVFDKPKVAENVDAADNFSGMQAIVFARNACFNLARKLGVRYFMQLDDDYVEFRWRFNSLNQYIDWMSIGPTGRSSLDSIFRILLRFYIDSGVASLALAQGGDFIGGPLHRNSERPMLLRKCMNSFICSTDRQFSFKGRMNEDVSAYTQQASVGKLFFTTNQVILKQKPTQSLSGGMTESYKIGGTYIKSFYSIMYHPSSVSISMMGMRNERIHHRVEWKNTVPKILDESWRKSS